MVSMSLPSWMHPYLYACVLGAEVDGAVVGRIRDAEDVSDIVGRPERVEMPEGRRAPDLPSQQMLVCTVPDFLH
jgi:hypothetical protein